VASDQRAAPQAAARARTHALQAMQGGGRPARSATPARSPNQRNALFERLSLSPASPAARRATRLAFPGPGQAATAAAPARARALLDLPCRGIHRSTPNAEKTQCLCVVYSTVLSLPGP
jgi:hypothetical protein